MEEHRVRMEVTRAAEQPADHSFRMQADQERNQVLREEENEVETVARRAANRERMQEIREVEEIPPGTSTEQTREAPRTAMARRRRIFDGFSSSTGTLSGYLEPGLMDVECPKCHALHFIEERNVGSSVPYPVLSNYCSCGEVSFPLLEEPPDLRRQLLTGLAPAEREFRKNLRTYNNALAMGSETAQWGNYGLGSSS